MIRIICNSGPLIAFGILGKLELLKSLFDEVIVPDAVQREIVQGGVRFSGLEEFRSADWIRIVPPKQSDALLAALPDTGEAADYRVESTSSLSSPVTWSNVDGRFQTVGGSIRIVVPITGGQKFYRLVKP